ncbi:hypothetical protein BYT27DRAFT_6652894 [Phlegmacium glaucopus]|nr:hypothetical protein BYT27DRAFT_6652894 [Phlegmacium glaucopus]
MALPHQIFRTMPNPLLSGGKIVRMRGKSQAYRYEVHNFALSLELLERACCEYGVLRYSNIQIGSGCLEQIFEHEKTHVQFLESALTAAGTEYVKPLTINLLMTLLI